MTAVRPGPWGPYAGTGQASAAPPAPASQDPLWALLSTALLAGLLWWLMGWIFALAGVVGVLVHEYGHVLAMNRLGMGPARIYVVPFLGGAAVPRTAARTEWIDVQVSLAGPAFGLLAALPFLGLHLATGEAVWLQGVWFIGLINLFNLAPAPPLDGSRALGPVLARIHPMLEKAALIAVGLGVVAWGLMGGMYILAVFIGLSVIGHLKRGAWRPDSAPLAWREAGAAVGLYLMVAALCLSVALVPTVLRGLGG